MTRTKAIVIAVVLETLVVAGVAVGFITHALEPQVLVMLALVLFSGTGTLLIAALRPAKPPRDGSDALAGYAVSSSLGQPRKS